MSSGPKRVLPHYRQTTDFTCGPAACLMAMKSLDGRKPRGGSGGLAIWREATTIFMGPAGGHGGCGALGLALAWHRRGFRPEVHVNHRGVLLGMRSRAADRREAMRLIQERDLADAKARQIPVHYDRLSVDDLEAATRGGAIAIVLCSTRYVHGDNVPHWIVVAGFDAGTVRINDPWVSLAKGKTARDMTGVPIPRRDFDKMACYGSERERAVVLVRKP